jgi:hypothetical protein
MRAQRAFRNGALSASAIVRPRPSWAHPLATRASDWSGAHPRWRDDPSIIWGTRPGRDTCAPDYSSSSHPCWLSALMAGLGAGTRLIDACLGRDGLTPRAKLQANPINCERSELPKIACQLQRSLGRGRIVAAHTQGSVPFASPNCIRCRRTMLSPCHPPRS